MRDDDKNYNYTKSEYKRDSFEMVQDSLKVNLGTGTKNFELSQEEKKATLRNRALVLAKEVEKTGEDSSYLKVVEFLLAHEKYALELFHISEVYTLQEFTPVPCTPPFVLGIINVRGQIISIIDLRVFFDLPQGGITNLNRVIILSSHTMEFGILADEILGVREISIHDIQTSLPMFTGVRAEYLKGVTKDRVVILDGEKILADRNIVVHTEVEV